MGRNEEEQRVQKIRDFLQEVKKTITRRGSAEQGWRFVTRRENMACLGELGLTFKDVRDVLLGLMVTDYCEGPLRDSDMPGDLWVFGKVIGGSEVYVKLKLATFDVLRIVRVVSFHPARESLRYPFRQ